VFWITRIFIFISCFFIQYFVLTKKPPVLTVALRRAIAATKRADEVI
jgi:hypothetical protein